MIYRLLILVFFLAHLSHATEIEVKDFAVRQFDSSGNEFKLYLVKNKGVKLSRLSLFVDGIHGNEKTGIVQKLMKEHSPGMDLYLARGGAFLFIPVLNHTAFRRNNEMIDLNRDFTENPKSLEVKNFMIAVNYILDFESIFKIDLVLDFHCCERALIQNDELSAKELELVAEIVGDNGISLGFPDEILGYQEKRIPGTLISYFSRTYGALSLGYEAQNLENDGDWIPEGLSRFYIKLLSQSLN